ncbi:hypothetical protein CF319_g3326 [Tilletia indica]|nr:hypothetical protein CF319_g3326 [Tilletia indica]
MALLYSSGSAAVARRTGTHVSLASASRTSGSLMRRSAVFSNTMSLCSAASAGSLRGVGISSGALLRKGSTATRPIGSGLSSATSRTYSSRFTPKSSLGSRSLTTSSSSSSHHSHGSSGDRQRLYATLAAAGLGAGGALLLHTFTSSQVHLDAANDKDSTHSPHRDRFAESIGEIEEKEAQSAKRNPIVRLFIRIHTWLQTWIIEPIGTGKRFLVLVFLFAPLIITLPMLMVGRRREGGRRRGRKVATSEDGQRWGAMWWFSFLVKQMERAGPTFIKLAQWAGSRQDLFPKELCDMLGKLHSNGKPHSFAYSKKVLERVFARPFDEIFEEFAKEPLGIGAVAQVYKATLRSDLLPPSYLEDKKNPSSPLAKSKYAQQLALTYDEDSAPPKIPTASVAIKILHPKVERTIARDLKIMSFFANLINLIPGAEWLSFPEEVDVFAGMMFSQLDLRNEAENLLKFEENFKKRRAAVQFPRPLPEFSTKEVLIEEHEDALPLKHFLNFGGGEFDHRIANLGLDAFLNMLLIDNFTHADLHPGNIMIKFYKPTTKSLLKDLLHRVLSRFDSDYARGGVKAAPTADDLSDDDVTHRLRQLKDDHDGWLDELDRLDGLGYQPELILIDAGLTVDLTPTNRRNFLELFSAVAQFDGARAGQLMVERCRMPELVVDEETFALKMQDLVLSVKSKTFSLGKIRIGDVLSQVLTAVREHHVKMEPDFVNTVISILLLEGIGRQLDPNMDLFKSALPILRSLGRQLSHGDGSSGLPRPHSLREIGPMLKVWLYLEARSALSGFGDPAMVDAFVRYDLSSP